MKEDAMNNLYNSIIFIVIAVIFLIVYIAKNKVKSIEDFKKSKKTLFSISMICLLLAGAKLYFYIEETQKSEKLNTKQVQQQEIKETKDNNENDSIRTGNIREDIKQFQELKSKIYEYFEYMYSPNSQHNQNRSVDELDNLKKADKILLEEHFKKIDNVMSKCLSENRYFKNSEFELFSSELNKINELVNKWKKNVQTGESNKETQEKQETKKQQDEKDLYKVLEKVTQIRPIMNGFKTKRIGSFAYVITSKLTFDKFTSKDISDYLDKMLDKNKTEKINYIILQVDDEFYHIATPYAISKVTVDSNFDIKEELDVFGYKNSKYINDKGKEIFK